MTICLRNCKKPALILALVLLALPFCHSVQAQESAAGQSQITFAQEPLSIKTAQKTHKFTVELAQSRQQHERGLMFRQNLAKDKGMLFLNTQDINETMWMKNTLISLDMLFIDSSGKIVYIAARTTPQSLAHISAGRPTRAVLELAGGAAEEKHIAVGDRIISEHFKP